LKSPHDLATVNNAPSCCETERGKYAGLINPESDRRTTAQWNAVRPQTLRGGGCVKDEYLNALERLGRFIIYQDLTNESGAGLLSPCRDPGNVRQLKNLEGELRHTLQDIAGRGLNDPAIVFCAPAISNFDG
jgi:hypothetical protein